MLRNLSLVDLEFSLRFERPTTIAPSVAGPMLRSAFGSQLRRIVCFDERTRKTRGGHVQKNAVFGNGWYEVLDDRC